MNPKDYRKQKHRPELEGILEQIVSGSASIADAGKHLKLFLLNFRKSRISVIPNLLPSIGLLVKI